LVRVLSVWLSAVLCVSSSMDVAACKLHQLVPSIVRTAR